jgi:transcription initiation factor TFIIH subunit 4
MSSQLETDSKPRDIPYLDSYAMERWECVLHYMVGSQQQEGISADAVRILLHAGLMKRSVNFMISCFDGRMGVKSISKGI